MVAMGGVEELGCTCTTPAREVSGIGWVGSLATVARWPARPSDMEAGEGSTFVAIGEGLLMEGLVPEGSCWPTREGWVDTGEGAEGWPCGREGGAMGTGGWLTAGPPLVWPGVGEGDWFPRAWGFGICEARLDNVCFCELYFSSL